MGSLLLSLTLVSAAVGQTPAPKAANLQLEIDLAVRDLGSRKFSERRRAHRFLWAQGTAAEDALNQALKSDDAEVRYRAKDILRDFRYGIRPGIPQEVTSLIRTFRDGDTAQRTAAFRELAQGKQMKILAHLVGLDRDLTSRTNLLNSLMHIGPTASRLADFKRLDEFLKSIEPIPAKQLPEQFDEYAWRRTMSVRMMLTLLQYASRLQSVSSASLKSAVEYLLAKESLASLLESVETEKDEKAREQMISAMFQNRNIVGVLLTNKQLSAVLKLIALEPDEQRRGYWINVMLSSTEAVEQLLEDKKFEDVLEFANKHVEKDMRMNIYRWMFNNNAIIELLLKQRKLDGLMELTNRISDPAMRGQVLASLLVSQAIQQRLMRERGGENIAITTARDLKPPTRQEYLKALVHSGISYQLLRQRKPREAIWKLIRSDEGGNEQGDQEWRLAALVRIIAISSDAAILLRDKSETEWLIKMLTEVVAEESRGPRMLEFVQQANIRKHLIQNGHFDELLKIARSQDPDMRGQILGRLSGSSELTQLLQSENRLDLLIDIATNEQDDDARRGYLTLFFASTTAIAALVSEGRFDDLFALVKSEKDELGRASLMAGFVQTNAIVQQLVSRKQLKLLVDFAREQTSEAARAQYLSQLFKNYQAMQTLISHGHFDALQKLAEGEKNEGTRQELLTAFYSNGNVVKHLVENRNVKEIIEFAATDVNDSARSNILRQLFSNQQALKIVLKENLLNRALEVTRTLRQEYTRASVLQAIYGAPLVIKHFASTKSIGKYVVMLRNETPNVRTQLLSNLLYQEAAIEALLNALGIDETLALLDADPQQNSQRGYMLVRLLTHKVMIARLKKEKRVSLLISLANDEMDANSRQTYLQNLFRNQTAMSLLIEDGRFGEMFDMAQASQTEQGRATLLAAFVSTEAAITELAKVERTDLLLQLGTRFNDTNARTIWLTGLFNSQHAMAALIKDGHFEDLFKLCVAEKDKTKKQSLLIAFYASPAVTSLIAKQKKFETILVFAESLPDNQARSFIQRLVYNQPAMDAMAKAGQLHRIVKLAQREPNEWSRASLLEAIFRSSAAATYLTEKDNFKTFLEMLSKDTDTVRGRVFQGLFNNSTTLKLLVQKIAPEKLLAMTKDVEPGYTRGYMLGNLISQSDFLKKLAAAKKMGVLLDIANDEVDPRARNNYLQRVLGSSDAIGALLKGSVKTADLIKLAKSPTDPTQRATMIGVLFSNSAFSQQIPAQERLDSLLKLAREEKAEPARAQYIQHMVNGNDLFNNTEMFNKLVESGTYDEIVKLMDSVRNIQSKSIALYTFYGSPNVIARQIKLKQFGKIVEVAGQLTGTYQSNLVQRVFYNQAAVQQVLSGGHLETLLDLVQKPSNSGNYRGSVLGTILGRPEVLRYLVGRKELDLVFKIAREQPDAVRQQMLQQIINQSESISILIVNDRFDSLAELTKGLQAKGAAGSVYAALVTSSAGFQYLKKKNRIHELIEIARELDDEGARYTFLSTAFGNTIVISALIEQGHFEEVLKMADGMSQASQRGQLIGRLLANSSTIAYLVKQKKVDVLLKYTEKLSDPSTRYTYLYQILASSNALAVLVESNKFDEIHKLCKNEKNKSYRHQLLTQLLTQQLAIQYLAKAGTLKDDVSALLEETGTDQTPYVLDRLLQSSSSAKEMLLAADGVFELLHAAVKEENETNRRRHIGYLMASRVGIERLVATGKPEDLLTMIEDQPSGSQRMSFIQRLGRNPRALDLLLSDEQFPRFLKLVTNGGEDRYRANMLRYVLTISQTVPVIVKHKRGPALVRAFAAAATEDERRYFLQAVLSPATNSPTRPLLRDGAIGDELIKIIEAVPNESQRLGYVRQVLTATTIYQTLIASNQMNVLERLVKMLPEAQQESFRRRLVQSTSGLIANHIFHGRDDEAQKLLEVDATNPQGQMRLATWLLTTGQLEARIDRVRQEWQARPSPETARWLTYLLRANGDLAGAVEAAEKAEHVGLRKAILVEHRQWLAAAALQAEDPCVLPVPLTAPTEETHQQVEQLSMVAAYQSMADRPDLVEQTLDKIRDLAKQNPDDKQLAWFCVEALLLNDDVDGGLKLAAEAAPLKAFDLFTFRSEYDKALEVIRWPKGKSPDSEWLDSLPTMERSTTPVALRKFDTAIKVAYTLNALGRRDDFQQLVSLLEDFAEKQPTGNSSSAYQLQCWQKLSIALTRLGYAQQGFDYGERALVSRTSTPLFFSGVYGRSRFQEARGWWYFFTARHSSKSPAERMAMVHAVLQPASTEEFDKLAALTDEAEKIAETQDEYRQAYILTSLARTWLSRGDAERARGFLDGIKVSDTDRPLLAETLRRCEAWAEAGEQYRQIWDSNRENLTALYLAGDCLTRAEDADGERLKRLTVRMAFNARARRDLATGLLSVGLTDAALEQYRLVLRTAAPESWEWNDAVRHVGDLSIKTDPGEAATLVAWSLIDDLRTTFFLTRTSDYLRVRGEVHRLRATAAIAAGEFDRVRQSIDQCLKGSVGSSTISETLIPLLESASQTGLADDLFARQFEAHRAAVASHPESGRLNNNIAWLSARSGRKLDEAMKYSQKAVKLAPAEGAYLDTLAEVYFRQGNRQQAIETSEKAVARSPGNDGLRQQLERFRNADLPGSSPRQASEER